MDTKRNFLLVRPIADDRLRITVLRGDSESFVSLTVQILSL